MLGMFLCFLLKADSSMYVHLLHTGTPDRHSLVGCGCGVGALHAEALKCLPHLAGITCPVASLLNYLFQNLRIISFMLLGI